ncbi:MAG: PilZ domain-containing protein [Aestuariibacter sp.]
MDAKTITGERYKINLSEHFRIGQRVKVDFKKAQCHFYTELVGFSYDQYLLLKAPNSSKYADIIPKLTTKTSFVIRTIFENTNGDCVVFKSDLLGKISNPEAILIFSFPAEGVTRPLRKTPRVPMNVHADIIVNNPDRKTIRIKGSLVDLSEHGCGFEFFSEQYRRVKHDQLTIKFIHPDTEQTIQKHVSVRHQRRYGNKIVLGLAYSSQQELFEESIELDYESDYLNYDEPPLNQSINPLS